MREKITDNMQMFTSISKRAHHILCPKTLLIGAFAAFTLGACATDPVGNENRPKAMQHDLYKINVTHPYTPNGTMGKKLVRVALIAPFGSSSGAAKNEADNIKAATMLALEKYGDGQTVLFFEDSGDTPQEAANAAKSAISKGADFILGPMFASGVTAAAPYARANKTTLFSFSTDTNEAGRGIYIFSFLPDDEINKIIDYSARRGIKNLALLLPVGPYGDRVEKSAINMSRVKGINIISTEKYDPRTNPQSIDLAAKRTAIATKGRGNRNTLAILIPERGAILRQLAKTLSTNGASTSRVQFIGTGLWNDAATITDSRMFGGWFVSSANEKRDDFAQELQAKGASATRLAGMGYDAMSLIAQTARKGDKTAISARLLERNSGFTGVDGRFRFNDNIIERTMPIMEITGDGARMIEAPPKDF